MRGRRKGILLVSTASTDVFFAVFSSNLISIASARITRIHSLGCS
jgi:hypothetical protein